MFLKRSSLFLTRPLPPAIRHALIDLGWYHPQRDRLQLTAPHGAWLVLWILVMISLPIQKWTIGEAALPWGISLGVLTQLATVFAILRLTWSWRRIALTTLGVAGLTWLAEAIGTATGFPFGAYVYTERLQPQLAHVPLLIPLAWMMLLPSAWAVAYCLTRTWRGPAFVVLSAIALTAWDLFLDPQMVAWNLWVWTNPGGYFGIPWQNFFGWLLTSAIITLVVRPARLPLRPLLLIYGITWILETIGLFFFWGLPGPAIVGFLAMGSLLFLAWRRFPTPESQN